MRHWAEELMSLFGWYLLFFSLFEWHLLFFSKAIESQDLKIHESAFRYNFYDCE